MNLLSFLLRSSKMTLAISVAVGVISGFGSALLIVLINKVLNRNAGAGTVYAFLALCVLILVSAIICQVASGYLVHTSVFKLRMELSSRILATPLRQLEQIGMHRLLASLTDDINSIALSLLSISQLCINAVTIIVCLIYLAWLSMFAFIILVGFLVVGVVIYEILESHAMRFLSFAREEWDALMSHFRALTEGIKELKLHQQRRKAFLSDVLGSAAISMRRHSIFGIAVYAAAGSWTYALFYTAIGLLLFALPLLQDMRMEIVTGYTLTIIFMMGPLGAIVAVAPQLARASISMKKIESLGLSLKHEPNSTDSESLSAEPELGRLELINVTHSYNQENEDKFTLGPVNLAFVPGELIFLAGGNGSGKSTLAKVLVGLYVPESGEIRFDGKLITDENRNWYREHFSIVFADFFLFEQLLGLISPQLDDQARHHLVQLQLDDKVRVKDGKLSTTALSQGQRKRLALLTAYLEDRPFYIFDEWASDQDPFFKEVFYLQILPNLKSRGKTVLAITHDEKYFHVADRIIKLDYGKTDSDERADTKQMIILSR